MIGITIGGTNQDAKRRLRESPCGRTEATLMTSPWKRRRGIRAASGGQTLRIWTPIGIQTRMSIFLECLIVSTDDTATTAATAGNGDFGTSPFFGGSQANHNLLVTILFGVSGAKAQGPDREIRCRIIYLPSGRVSPASIAKSEFRQIALYVRKWPCVTSNAGPHGDA